MTDPASPTVDFRLERVLPRMQKNALGLAIGLTGGAGVLIVTVFHLLVRPDVFPPGLLTHFFYGYALTWPGACAGAAWGAAVGFATGWLLALVHNVHLDLWLLVLRAKADLSQRRDILDQLR